MPRPGAERAHAPQEALTDDERMVDAAFEGGHDRALRESKDYQNLLKAFKRVGAEKRSISLKEFNEMLDGVLNQAEGEDFNRLPKPVQKRIEAARLFDADMKEGIVAPETYATKRFVNAETEPEIPVVANVEAVANVEMDLSDEEPSDEAVEVDLEEALDEADVERARNHPVYKFLLDRLQEAADGDGGAESVMAEVASSKDSASTSTNPEEVLAATEQFEADLSGPLAEQWHHAFQRDAKMAAQQAAEISPRAERQWREPTVDNGRNKRESKMLRSYLGQTPEAQRVYRELLDEYRAEHAEAAPNAEELKAYQEKLREAMEQASDPNEKTAIAVFAEDLNSGVVHELAKSADPDAEFIQLEAWQSIGFAKERLRREPNKAPDVVRQVAALNVDQVMRLYGAQKQLDSMSFFGRTFSKAGRAAKQARKELESLEALMFEVVKMEVKNEEIVYKEVPKKVRVPMFDSLHTEWPQEVNSIIGAVSAGERTSKEAVAALDDLDADTLNAWTGSLIGKTIRYYMPLTNGESIGAATIESIRKDKGDKVRIILRDRKGKKTNLLLATFLKHNIEPTEQTVRDQAA